MNLKEWLNLDKKILIHDMDVDGTCSASLFLKAADFEHFYLKDRKLTEESVNFFIGKKPGLIIFLDIAVDKDLDCLIKMKSGIKDVKIIVIDHHTITNNLNKYGILYINPRLKDKESYIPTSLLSFNLLEESGLDVEKHLWLSCIGTIADYGHKTNPEFMKRCLKKYSKYLDADDIFESKFGKATRIIYSAITYKGNYGVKYVLKALKEAEDVDDILKNHTLRIWSENVEKEIKKVMKDFEANKEIKGKTLFFKMNTKLGLTSIISSLATKKHPDKVIIIAKESEEGWKISSRDPSGIIDLSMMMKKASEGIGNGGGHPRAAGGFVKDLDLFKKRIEKLVK